MHRGGRMTGHQLLLQPHNERHIAAVRATHDAMIGVGLSSSIRTSDPINQKGRIDTVRTGKLKLYLALLFLRPIYRAKSNVLHHQWTRELPLRPSKGGVGRKLPLTEHAGLPQNLQCACLSATGCGAGKHEHEGRYCKSFLHLAIRPVLGFPNGQNRSQFANLQCRLPAPMWSGRASQEGFAHTDGPRGCVGDDGTNAWHGHQALAGSVLFGDGRNLPRKHLDRLVVPAPVEWPSRLGPAPTQQTPQALASHHKAEIEKWTSMIKAAKIKVE